MVLIIVKGRALAFLEHALQVGLHQFFASKNFGKIGG